MNKLGVIQIIDSLNAGGAEVLAVNIANGLAEKEINSHICSTREEGVLINNISKNVSFLFLNRKSTFDFLALIKFVKYIKKNNITIIHAHSTSYFFALCVKVFYSKVAVIWHDHYGKSQNLDLRNLFPINICSYFFKSIISVNTDLKKWSEEKLNCKDVFFLNNFAEFTIKDKVTKLKGIEGKRIVHLAAFREQKDHLNLLSSFKIVIKSYPDYTLHLIGEIKKDKYSNDIKKFIKENKLIDTVFLYGVCTDIKHILNQSSIGVLSSKSEGLPVALLEYGLANLSVLTTDVGECESVINHNKGVVVSERSDIFAKALIEIIQDDLLRKEISKSLNNSVISFYSKENFILKIKKIYDK
jgi:glycosyltransferase involved in cell wall biosynthesis